jgi:hypothetical protein
LSLSNPRKKLESTTSIHGVGLGSARIIRRMISSTAKLRSLPERSPWQDGRFNLDRAARRLLTTVH